MSFEIKKKDLKRPTGAFFSSRGSSNLFEIIKNKKHGRMMRILAFLQNVDKILEMTLNDLRVRKIFF